MITQAVRIGCVMGTMLLVSAGGCQRGLPPDADNQPAVPSAAATADYTTTVNQLINEYKRDAAAWQSSHTGHSVELTGKLSEYVFPPDGKTVLVLEPEPLDIYRVWCYALDDHLWEQATPGQTVTLRGIVIDSAEAPNVDECQLVAVTGPAAATVTADSLADYYGRTGFGPEGDYGSNFVILSGTVAGVGTYASPEGIRWQLVELNANSQWARKARVVVLCHQHNDSDWESLAPGDPVRILARFLLNGVTDAEIHLTDGILLKGKS